MKIYIEAQFNLEQRHWQALFKDLEIWLSSSNWQQTKEDVVLIRFFSLIHLELLLKSMHHAWLNFAQ